ncbi:MAG TPA: rhomboid family intramembrane serine protease [Mycobacteriales bacterium]|nr:rhomboid family intramembrane serine protease [Mycobacteriales bacterium]
MDLRTVALYGCAAAVVAPGSQLLTALAVPVGQGHGGSPARLVRAAWRRPVPLVSAMVVTVMAVLAVAQSVFPALVGHLERDPAGPWWRLLSALLVQSSGWVQTVFNLVALAAVAPVAERVLGPARWLLVYLASGLAANAVSAAGWSPRGAGDSVAICGLVGALAAQYTLGGPSPALRRLLVLIPAAGAALCLLANNHGVGVLTGYALGAANTALTSRGMPAGDHTGPA